MTGSSRESNSLEPVGMWTYDSRFRRADLKHPLTVVNSFLVILCTLVLIPGENLRSAEPPVR